MVEKVGHKKMMTKYRLDWIREGKPGHSHSSENDGHDPSSVTLQATADGAEDNRSNTRHQTPLPADDVPDDEDIYDATPQAARNAPTTTTQENAVPDMDDDLDALIAEAEETITSATNGAGVHNSTLSPEPTGDFADEEAALMEMDGLW